MIREKEKNNLKIHDITDIQKIIQPILGKHPIKRASIFGSYARQEARRESDIDILVEFSSSISLIQFVSIQLELEDILGKKVDLVEVSTLKPQLKANILKEQIEIYG
jgi:predicted nucleotidyltransferase